MADSFFGFDTTLPLEDEDGGIETEEQYDALNDETFGDAINGDWENIHENLVRLSGRAAINNNSRTQHFSSNNHINNNSTPKKHHIQPDDDSDLELSLAQVALDDCEIGIDDEHRVITDPSVWASPTISSKPAQHQQQPIHHQQQQQHNSNNDLTNLYQQQSFMRQQFVHQFGQNLNLSQLQQQQLQQQQQQNNLLGNIHSSSPTPIPNKICTVEDIERNIRDQIDKQQPQKNNNQHSPRENVSDNLVNHGNLQQQQLPRQPLPPPGFPIPPRGMPLPMGNMHPTHRLPPGFHPMIMGPHMGNMPHPGAMQRPILPNVPMHLNNFPIPHPNFPIRQPPPMQMHQQRMPPLILPPNFQHNSNNAQNNNVNQFNKRLVQEIQLNHPMLSFNRANGNGNNNNNSGNNGNGNNQQTHNPQNNNNTKMYHNQNQQKHDGNLNLEAKDEYANLMSNRDKQWLIGIQLMQLSSETPYIDDFYYTVYRERQASLKGDRESKAHKANTLNHPFTQPKGHAHLLLISMGKNGTHHHHQRNGQNNRERKNSESKNDKEQTPRTYTPLQFENSLGKLQCGSVTAPRKIIDMDIVGSDSSVQLNSTIELSAQRKSRQLLLHIETLYKVVLKLEDLVNPIAIANAKIVKEKKEKERQLAIEIARIEQLNEGREKVEPVSLSSAINADKNVVEPETYSELLLKLLTYTSADKVVAMMTVRKGKTLLRRAIPHIKDHPHRWEVWCAIFAGLARIVRLDKDDSDGLLLFYPEFERHIDAGDMSDVLKITTALTMSDKKLSFMFKNKFCVSTILCLIMKVEDIYILSKNKITPDEEKAWTLFLCNLLNSINSKNIQENNNAQINDDVLIKPLITHFSRFRDIKLQPLLTVLSQIDFK